jgi:hypothetical protein
MGVECFDDDGQTDRYDKANGRFLQLLFESA